MAKLNVKSFILNLIKIAVTVAILYLIFKKFNIGSKDILNSFKHQPAWFGAALLMQAGAILFSILRWRTLLKGQDLHIPFGRAVRTFMVGRFLGTFTPTGVGIEAYKAWDIARYTGKTEASVTVVLIEKLIGTFFSLGILVLLTLPFFINAIDQRALIIFGAFFGILLVIALILMFQPGLFRLFLKINFPGKRKVEKPLQRIVDAFTIYSERKRSLLTAVALGFGVYICWFLTYYMNSLALGANLSLMDVLKVGPLTQIATMLPISIAGAGLREGAFMTLLQATGALAANAPKEVATAIMLSATMVYFVSISLNLIGAVLFLMRRKVDRFEPLPSKAAPNPTPKKTSAVSQIGSAVSCAFAGIGAGLAGGAIIGLVEAIWIRTTLTGLSDLSAFWWGPLAYAIVFAGIGLGMACALVVLSLAVRRFPSATVTFGLCFGGVITSSGIIAFWRFNRDILQGHTATLQQAVMFLSGFVAAGLICALVAWITARMLRRRPLALTGAVVAVVAALILGGAGYASLAALPSKAAQYHEPAKGPNVILIAADALRADYLKLYSQEAETSTPGLEALANDGILFRHHVSQASWTKPSFATIFSGLYASSHTATSKMAMLPDSVNTFPEILQGGGYYTKGFSNNGNIASSFNFNQGFSDYVDPHVRLYFDAGASASDLSMYQILRRARHIAMSKISEKMDVEDFYQPAENVTRDALSWLDNKRPSDRPFFLFLHYMDTHDPFMDHTQPGVGYARVRMQNPDPEKYLVPMKRAYNSEIDYMDRHLAALFEGLKTRGLYDNSVIVFTSDHGEEFYDHDGWWHGQTLFDEVILVPMIVKLPGQQGAGVVNDGLSRHIDIAPTLLSLAGLTPAGEMPGLSLLNANGTLANGHVTFVYAENDFENNVIETVRTRDAKVIRENPENARKLPPRQFYDLANDPKEKHNRAGMSDAREAELGQLIEQMRQYVQGAAAEPTMAAELSQEEKDQLEAIGYSGD